MTKVSWGRCTATQLASKVTGSTIVVGRMYVVTVSSSIISIVRGLTTSTYEIVLGNVVATKPTIAANGRSLAYYDGSGTLQNIDFSTMTVGDNTTPATVLAGAETGDILNGDTLQKALIRVQNRSKSLNDATKTYVDNKVVSMMNLRGDINANADIILIDAVSIKAGYAYRVNTGGYYIDTILCEQGDLLICTQDCLVAGNAYMNPDLWTVLQNNLDLAGLVVNVTVNGGLVITDSANGRTVALNTVTLTNTASYGNVGFGQTISYVDSVTRDAHGIVTAVNIKTTTLPSETTISGLTSNANSAYKMLVNLTSNGHVLTGTYASMIDMLLTGFVLSADTGAIVATDSLNKALSRLHNRIVALETTSTSLAFDLNIAIQDIANNVTAINTIEGLLDWIEG